MWYRGVAVSLLVVLAAPSAAAQPADGAAAAPQPAPPLGYGAMPGGLHAASAVTLPAGVLAVGALGGYGFRSDLLGDGHSFTRALGDLAFAYAPISTLTLGLSFDGRYDKHTGLAAAADDGYVGDPHLLIRAAKPFGTARLGAQLGIWVPGKDAPSVAAAAITVDGRLLASIAAGGATISFAAGFRLDNSAKSVEAPERLSASDRVSLGVSSFHAVLGGVHVAIPVGKALFVGVEASTDLFVGGDAPGPIVRGAASAGVRLTPQWSLLAFVEGSRVPAIEAADVMSGDIALVPYEPLLTAGLGLQGRFGGARRETKTKTKGTVTGNDRPRPIEVIEHAELTGEVVDEAGRPIVGVEVVVKLKNTTGRDATDDQGRFAIEKLPIGKTVDGKTTLDDALAEVSAGTDNRKPASSTLTLVKGANAVPQIVLEPMLPPGQLHAVVRAAGTGLGIAKAVVTIEPGGATATADANGTLSLVLPPGQYTAKATAPGFKPQSLTVTIPEGGVTVKNFELRK